MNTQHVLAHQSVLFSMRHPARLTKPTPSERTLVGEQLSMGPLLANICPVLPWQALRVRVRTVPGHQKSCKYSPCGASWDTAVPGYYENYLSFSPACACACACTCACACLCLCLCLCGYAGPADLQCFCGRHDSHLLS